MRLKSGKIALIAACIMLVLINSFIGTKLKIKAATAQNQSITPVLASSGTTLAYLPPEGKVLVYEGLPKATLKATLSKSSPFDQVTISGDTILASSSMANDGKGAVYIYKRQGDQWAESGTLKSNETDKRFGGALAAQGKTLLVGFQNSEVGGSVQVEYQSAATAANALTARLDTNASGGITGAALAVDGDYILVGLPGLGVQVFLRNADTWDKQTLLIPEDGQIPDSFGSVIAFAGRTALIGAPDSNSFYIFTRGDTAWAQRQVFTEEKNLNFGQALAIFDTDILAAGSQGATIYYRENSPQWKAATSFKAQGDNFGKAATITKGIAAVSSADGIVLYEGKGAQWKQTSILK